MVAWFRINDYLNLFDIIWHLGLQIFDQRHKSSYSNALTQDFRYLHERLRKLTKLHDEDFWEQPEGLQLVLTQ